MLRAWTAIMAAMGATSAALFAAEPATVTNEYTAFGLLAAVLVSVGLFLRWWLPRQLEAYREDTATQRQAFREEMAELRKAFSAGLDRQQASYDAHLTQIRRMLSGPASGRCPALEAFESQESSHA